MQPEEGRRVNDQIGREKEREEVSIQTQLLRILYVQLRS